MFESEYILLLLPLGVIAVMAGAYGVMAAAGGRAWAAMTLLFVTIFLLDTIFRARAYSDKSIDLQIILKAGSWVAIFLFALLHFRRYAGALFRVPHLLWLLFFCWLLATTPNSPNPTYTAMAVFSVVAFYLACLALHADYDREMVLAVILGSCLLVVVLSLFAYVAIPSFGRLEEWQGGAQIQGHRLSGITGTPNGIGIISAWCALVIAIHWHALRRYLHSSILFFGGLTALVTLALSQSRTAMAVFLVLTGITFTLRRRYTPYLLISGAIIVMVVAIFAISDSDLFVRLLSRSGKCYGNRDWDRPGADLVTCHQARPVEFLDGTRLCQHCFHSSRLQRLYELRSTARTQHVAATLAYDGHDRRDPFQPGVRFADYSRIFDKDGLSITFLAFVMLDGITEPSAFAGVAHLSTVVLLIAAARSIHGPSVGARGHRPPLFRSNGELSHRLEKPNFQNMTQPSRAQERRAQQDQFFLLRLSSRTAHRHGKTPRKTCSFLPLVEPRRSMPPDQHIMPPAAPPVVSTLQILR